MTLPATLFYPGAKWSAITLYGENRVTYINFGYSNINDATNNN